MKYKTQSVSSQYVSARKLEDVIIVLYLVATTLYCYQIGMLCYVESKVTPKGWVLLFLFLVSAGIKTWFSNSYFIHIKWVP